MSPAPRRQLGATDLRVFPLNLGGNVFGWTADRATSFAVLDAYREAGGNFVDTADVYSKWVPGHRGGESEEVIGAWMRERGSRDAMVIATKVGMGGPEIGEGLSAAQVRKGCDNSLQRLGTDRIDLFYAHKDDPNTPLEETLGAFDALVKEGKVRWIAASNYAAPRLRQALEVSAKNGLARYAVVQPEYNLVSRGVLEGELSELCRKERLGVCTYYALAAGFLSGKYKAGERPTSARAKRVGPLLENPRALATLEAVRALARARGATPSQIAVAWLLHRPEVTTPIASATSVAQLKELLGAVELKLSREEMAKLEAA